MVRSWPQDWAISSGNGVSHNPFPHTGAPLGLSQVSTVSLGMCIRSEHEMLVLFQTCSVRMRFTKQSCVSFLRDISTFVSVLVSCTYGFLCAGRAEGNRRGQSPTAFEARQSNVTARRAGQTCVAVTKYLPRGTCDENDRFCVCRSSGFTCMCLPAYSCICNVQTRTCRHIHAWNAHPIYPHKCIHASVCVHAQWMHVRRRVSLILQVQV